MHALPKIAEWACWFVFLRVGLAVVRGLHHEPSPRQFEQARLGLGHFFDSLDVRHQELLVFTTQKERGGRAEGGGEGRRTATVKYILITFDQHRTKRNLSAAKGVCWRSYHKHLTRKANLNPHNLRLPPPTFGLDDDCFSAQLQVAPVPNAPVAMLTFNLSVKRKVAGGCTIVLPSSGLETMISPSGSSASSALRRMPVAGVWIFSCNDFLVTRCGKNGLGSTQQRNFSKQHTR